MKTLNVLAIALGVLCFGCNDDDDNNANTAQLQGTWNLKRVHGGFGGADEQFANGAVKWTFDTIAQTVKVVNNQNPESAFDFFDSGTYDFQREAGNWGDCEETMKINLIGLGCVTLEGNTLTLSQAAADGFTITLKR